MIDFKNVDLLNSVPPNLLKDEKVQNLAKIITKQNQKFAKVAEKLNYIENLHDLDETIIDYLLWEKGIGYKEGLMLTTNIEDKIALLESAIYLHRIRGTPAAIEYVCELLNIKTTLQEWFEYGGEPYHFKIEIMEINDRGINEDTMKLLESLVMNYKNTRSELEAINIFFTSRHKPCIGGTCSSGEEITLYPFIPKQIELIGTYNVGAANSDFETTTIYPGRDNFE